MPPLLCISDSERYQLPQSARSLHEKFLIPSRLAYILCSPQTKHFFRANVGTVYSHFATRFHDSQGEIKNLMMNIFAAFYSALYFSILQLLYLDYQGSLSSWLTSKVFIKLFVNWFVSEGDCKQIEAEFSRDYELNNGLISNDIICGLNNCLMSNDIELLDVQWQKYLQEIMFIFFMVRPVWNSLAVVQKTFRFWCLYGVSSKVYQIQCRVLIVSGASFSASHSPSHPLPNLTVWMLHFLVSHMLCQEKAFQEVDQWIFFNCLFLCF